MVPAAVLEAAIATYNEYRAPMATAALLEATDETFVVRFEGPFRRMCCDYEYGEDLIYEPDEYGEDPDAIDIISIEADGDETFRVVFATRPEPMRRNAT